jgi:putative toxin-antitoxin system antitoxin component (TIGR02293 family)
MQLAHVSKVLGGKQVLHMSLNSQMDLVDLSRKGISKGALSHLAQYTSLSLAQIAKLLPITERTIQRYAAGECFNSAVSEQILEIARIVIRGEEVFGDKDNFMAWMHSKNPALDHRKPFDLLVSRFGMDLILDELGRIEHGVIA